jgi:hypothetical protein
MVSDNMAGQALTWPISLAPSQSYMHLHSFPPETSRSKWRAISLQIPRQSLLSLQHLIDTLGESSIDIYIPTHLKSHENGIIRPFGRYPWHSPSLHGPFRSAHRSLDRTASGIFQWPSGRPFGYPAVGTRLRHPMLFLMFGETLMIECR